MNEEIKCPQCGGTKEQVIGNNEYKCLYCGTVFKHNSNSQDSSSILNQTATNLLNQSAQSSHPIINVNVGNTQAQPTNSSNDALKNGVLGGAGFAAGGCLFTSLIYLAGPIIFFLVLLSMCS